MAMHNFFDLQTPEDLLRKVEREYERWKADPLNADFAWNFFVTAEHLRDWIYYQDMPTTGKKRPDLLDHKAPGDFKDTHLETRICSHLANGAKHFHLREERHHSVERTARAMSGWVEDGYVEDGWVGKAPVLQVSVTPDEQAALHWDAAERDALWFAARVLEFWQARLVLHTRPSGTPPP
jgi:hypothetical protein